MNWKFNYFLKLHSKNILHPHLNLGSFFQVLVLLEFEEHLNIKFFFIIFNKINLYFNYLELTTDDIFCNVFATLNLTFATGSFAKFNTVGSMIFWVNSWPHDCDKT